MIDVRSKMGKKCSSMQYVVRSSSGRWDYEKKDWVAKDKMVVGIFVGVRFLSNGYRSYQGSEEGWEFIKTGTVKVGLISEGPYKNPIPVPFDSIIFRK